MGDYYIKTKGEERGPYAESQLRSMWSSGAITSDTVFRPSDSQNWLPIGNLFNEEQSVSSAAAPTASTATPTVNAAPKKREAGAREFLIALFIITTVRVLKAVNAEMSSVYRSLAHEEGCERLEVFMRFSASSFFAKLPGCMPENLFSPNSPT